MHIIYYPGADNPETYELENLSADPDHLIERDMEQHVSLDGAVMLDIGAGSGFHAARFAEKAAHVYAVEPTPGMIRQFKARFAAAPMANVTLLEAGAERIPLPDISIDIAHARFSYFFGCWGNCDPGIEEIKRLLEPGGHFFIIDNYLRRGQFAQFLRLAYGEDSKMQDENDEFYSSRGFELLVVDSCWRAPDRGSLARLIEMEFPKCVDPIMNEIEGREISYSYALYHYVKPRG